MAVTPTSAGYRHVACCIESPDRSGPALAEAVRVAGPVGARLSLVHVTPTAGAFTGGRTSRSAPSGAVADHVHAEAAAWLTPIAREHGAEAVILAGDAPALALRRGRIAIASTSWSSRRTGAAWRDCWAASRPRLCVTRRAPCCWPRPTDRRGAAHAPGGGRVPRGRTLARTGRAAGT